TVLFITRLSRLGSDSTADAVDGSIVRDRAAVIATPRKPIAAFFFFPIIISPSSFFIIRAFQSPVCKISAGQINPNLPDWIPQFTAYFWNLNYYTTSPFDFLIQKYYVFFIFSHFYHKAFTDFTLFLHRSAYIFLMRKFYISFVHNRIVIMTSLS